MSNNELIDVAIKSVASLELKNNALGSAPYRSALLDAIQELKKLKTDEEPDRN